MPTRVDPTTASVSVSTVKPRVSIEITKPKLGAVSYALPAAAIDYILLQVEAESDSSGLFQFKGEVVAVLDTKTIAFAKALSDAVNPQDHVGKDVSKPLTDSVGLTETFSRLLTFIRQFADAFGLSDHVTVDTLKVLADSVGTTDTKTYSFSKFIPDGVAMNDTADVGDGLLVAVVKTIMNIVLMSDAKRIDVSKALTDQAEPTEAHSIHFSRPVSDSYTVVDTASLEPILNKSDSFALTDALRFDTSKLIADAFASVDTLSFAFDKPLSDSFGFTDEKVIKFDKALSDDFTFSEALSFTTELLRTDQFSLGDALAIAFSKTILGDTVSPTDFVSKDPGKGLSDSASPEDTGSLLAQGYCDITYFAEDYVGVSRSFT